MSFLLCRCTNQGAHVRHTAVEPARPPEYLVNTVLREVPWRGLEARREKSPLDQVTRADAEELVGGLCSSRSNSLRSAASSTARCRSRSSTSEPLAGSAGSPTFSVTGVPKPGKRFAPYTKSKWS